MLLKITAKGSSVLNIQADILKIGFSGKVKNPAKARYLCKLISDVVFWQRID
jgi:hypothetical protein